MGIFGKPLKSAIWNTLGLHAALAICLRFSSVLDVVCVVFSFQFWDVSKWLAGAYKSSASHLDHHQQLF